MKIGLKIWSSNTESFKILVELYNKKKIDYVELSTIPHTFSARKLKPLKDIPLIFHAPTYCQGFNISTKTSRYSDGVKAIKKFMGYFGPHKIIVHPGYNYTRSFVPLDKIIKNFKPLAKNFDILIENMPYVGISRGLKMVAPGYSEFKTLIESVGTGCCLDLSHAVCAANSFKENPYKFIKQFLKLKPQVIHVSDGVFKGEIDAHLGFGEGDYPLHKLFKLIPIDAHVTIETHKKDFKHLSEDIANLKTFKSIIKSKIK